MGHPNSPYDERSRIKLIKTPSPSCLTLRTVRSSTFQRGEEGPRTICELKDGTTGKVEVRDEDGLKTSVHGTLTIFFLLTPDPPPLRRLTGRRWRGKRVS